jgi:hypothetical protein
MKNSTKFKIKNGIIILMVFIIYLNGKVFSQEGVSGNEKAKNSLYDCSWSLQFQIMDKFILNSFQGTIISAKYHYSSNSALRFGIGINLSFSDDDSSPTDQNNTGTFNKNNSNSNQKGINFSGVYLFYPKPGSDINLYYGAGPFFSFSYSKSEYENSTLQENSTTSSTTFIGKTNSYSAGIYGILGVEWFATKSISFLAEYSVSVYYNHSKISNSNKDSNSTNTSDNEISDNNYGCNPTSVRFGISIYF